MSNTEKQSEPDDLIADFDSWLSRAEKSWVDLERMDTDPEKIREMRACSQVTSEIRQEFRKRFISEKQNQGGSDDLLAFQEIDGFAITPSCGWDEDFKASESMALTEEDAWGKFCHPALNRNAYESDGFKPIPIKVKIYAANTKA